MFESIIVASFMWMTPHQFHINHCRHVPTACQSQPTVVGGLQPLPVHTPLHEPQAGAWSRAALRVLGAPATVANLKTMYDWYQNEYIPHNYNNPLNLQEPYGGSWAASEDGDPIVPAHIQHYRTPNDFTHGFVIQMHNPSYPEILSDLMAGRGLENGTPELRSELSTYSGNGYDSIPASYCPCG